MLCERVLRNLSNGARACLKIGDVPSGEGFWAAGKQFFRRNPGGFQGKIVPSRGQKIRRLGMLTFFKQALEAVGFCPYNICLLGGHIHCQYGKINILVIDKGVRFSYKAKYSGICGSHLMNFTEKCAEFHITSVPKKEQRHWADHLHGVAQKLSEKYELQFGVAGVFERDLTIGGLASRWWQ